MSLIKCEDLYKTYQMGTQTVRALRGVDLQIEQGEYVSIMGPSGSGKSTLMHIIGCLDTPSSGKYTLLGNEVELMNDNQLAEIRNKEIGFVFQTFNLIPRSSAFHNVELPLIYSGHSKDERLRRVNRALEIVSLTDRATHRPNELSGGQRQRVAIARALVNKPAIILADEPTGNLDSETGEEIMLVFDELQKQGNTLIIVTHDEYVAKRADRVIHILDGTIKYDEVIK